MTEPAGDSAPPWERPTPPADPALRTHSEAIRQSLGLDSVAAFGALRPLAALREVLVVCDSLRQGRSAPQPHDRRSLVEDVNKSLASLGDELCRHLQPSLRDFRKREMVDLPNLLETSGGALRLYHTVEALHDRIRRADATQAAWRDLVRATGTGADEWEVTHLASVLIEIEESLGHEWRFRRMSLSEAIVEADFDRVEQLLAEPPSRSAEVAWFAFANADVPKGHLRIGQVQFFSHNIWPHMVRDEAALLRSYPEATFPAELDDRQVEQMSDLEHAGGDGNPSVVYVRVELAGERAAGNQNPFACGEPPDRWARDLVLSIVEAASFGWSGSEWTLLDGVFVYHGMIVAGGESWPNWSGNLSFTDPELFRRRPSLPHLEPTGEALRDLNPAFADRAAAQSPAVRDAVAEIRWYQSVRAQTDPAQRIALYVRAFERSLPLAELERWYDAVSRYFRDSWARSRFDKELVDLAFAADYELRTHDFDSLKAIGEWVKSRGIAQSVNIRSFALVIDQLDGALSRANADRAVRRRVRVAAKWLADPSECLARHTLLQSEFDRVLNRAVRQRNAVIHGVGTDPDVVASAEPLIARIAAWLVSYAIDAAATDTEAVAAIEAARSHARERLWKLECGDQPVLEVLYAMPETS